MDLSDIEISELKKNILKMHTYIPFEEFAEIVDKSTGGKFSFTQIKSLLEKIYPVEPENKGNGQDNFKGFHKKEKLLLLKTFSLSYKSTSTLITLNLFFEFIEKLLGFKLCSPLLAFCNIASFIQNVKQVSTLEFIYNLNLSLSEEININTFYSKIGLELNLDDLTGVLIFKSLDILKKGKIRVEDLVFVIDSYRDDSLSSEHSLIKSMKKDENSHKKILGESGFSLSLKKHAVAFKKALDSSFLTLDEVFKSESSDVGTSSLTNISINSEKLKKILVKELNNEDTEINKELSVAINIIIDNIKQSNNLVYKQDFENCITELTNEKLLNLNGIEKLPNLTIEKKVNDTQLYWITKLLTVLEESKITPVSLFTSSLDGLRGSLLPGSIINLDNLNKKLRLMLPPGKLNTMDINSICDVFDLKRNRLINYRDFNNLVDSVMTQESMKTTMNSNFKGNNKTELTSKGNQDKSNSNVYLLPIRGNYKIIKNIREEFEKNIEKNKLESTSAAKDNKKTNENNKSQAKKIFNEEKLEADQSSPDYLNNNDNAQEDKEIMLIEALESFTIYNKNGFSSSYAVYMFLNDRLTPHYQKKDIYSIIKSIDINKCGLISNFDMMHYLLNVIKHKSSKIAFVEICRKIYLELNIDIYLFFSKSFTKTDISYKEFNEFINQSFKIDKTIIKKIVNDIRILYNTFNKGLIKQTLHINNDSSVNNINISDFAEMLSDINDSLKNNSEITTASNKNKNLINGKLTEKEFEQQIKTFTRQYSCSEIISNVSGKKQVNLISNSSIFNENIMSCLNYSTSISEIKKKNSSMNFYEFKEYFLKPLKMDNVIGSVLFQLLKNTSHKDELVIKFDDLMTFLESYVENIEPSKVNSDNSNNFNFSSKSYVELLENSGCALRLCFDSIEYNSKGIITGMEIFNKLSIFYPSIDKRIHLQGLKLIESSYVEDRNEGFKYKGYVSFYQLQNFLCENTKNSNQKYSFILEIYKIASYLDGKGANQPISTIDFFTKKGIRDIYNITYNEHSILFDFLISTNDLKEEFFIYLCEKSKKQVGTPLSAKLTNKPPVISYTLPKLIELIDYYRINHPLNEKDRAKNLETKLLEIQSNKTASSKGALPILDKKKKFKPRLEVNLDRLKENVSFNKNKVIGFVVDDIEKVLFALQKQYLEEFEEFDNLENDCLRTDDDGLYTIDAKSFLIILKNRCLNSIEIRSFSEVEDLIKEFSFNGVNQSLVSKLKEKGLINYKNFIFNLIEFKIQSNKQSNKKLPNINNQRSSMFVQEEVAKATEFAPNRKKKKTVEAAVAKPANDDEFGDAEEEFQSEFNKRKQLPVNKTNNTVANNAKTKANTKINTKQAVIYSATESEEEEKPKVKPKPAATKKKVPSQSESEEESPKPKPQVVEKKKIPQKVNKEEVLPKPAAKKVQPKKKAPTPSESEEEEEKPKFKSKVVQSKKKVATPSESEEEKPIVKVQQKKKVVRSPSESEEEKPIQKSKDVIKKKAELPSEPEIEKQSKNKDNSKTAVKSKVNFKKTSILTTKLGTSLVTKMTLKNSKNEDLGPFTDFKYTIKPTDYYTAPFIDYKTKKPKVFATICNTEDAAIKICEDLFKSNIEIFEDQEFGESEKDKDLSRYSLYMTGKEQKGNLPPSAIGWYRLDQIYTGEDADEGQKNPLFLDDGAESNDVMQGALGDCWFISALSVIATKSYLLKGQYSPGILNDGIVDNEEIVMMTSGIYPPIFHPYRKKRIYCFRFFKNFKWRYVIIDDKLPCRRVQHSSEVPKLLYAKCRNEREFWVPLIEKAYAKLHGSYQALISGFIDEGLVDLTGLVSSKLCITKEQAEQQAQADELWDKILSWTSENHKSDSLNKKQKNNIKKKLDEQDNTYNKLKTLKALIFTNNKTMLGCSVDSKVVESEVIYHGNKCGILAGHAYSILDAFEIPKPKSKRPRKTSRLLRIRNPWGFKEWNGKFSDTSDELAKNKSIIQKLLDEKYKNTQEKINLDDEDGTFLMCFSDFRKIFNKIFVCVDFPPEILSVRFTKDAWNSNSSGGVPINNTPDEMKDWGKNPQYWIKLNSPSEITISVIQKDGRSYNDAFPYANFVKKCCLIIMRTENKKRMEVFDGNAVVNISPIRMGRENTVSLNFEKGEYLIVPSIFKKGEFSEFQLEVHFPDVIKGKYKTSDNLLNFIENTQFERLGDPSIKPELIAEDMADQIEDFDSESLINKKKFILSKMREMIDIQDDGDNIRVSKNEEKEDEDEDY